MLSFILITLACAPLWAQGAEQTQTRPLVMGTAEIAQDPGGALQGMPVTEDLFEPKGAVVADVSDAKASETPGANAVASASSTVNVPAPQIRVVRVSGGSSRPQPVVVNQPAQKPPTVIVNLSPASPAPSVPVAPAKGKKMSNGEIIAIVLPLAIAALAGVVLGIIGICCGGGRALPRLVEALTACGERKPGAERIRVTGSRDYFTMSVEPANPTPLIPPQPPAQPAGQVLVPLQIGVQPQILGPVPPQGGGPNP